MDSLQLKSFNSRWSVRFMLMEDQHNEEVASIEAETEKQKQNAKDNAKAKLDNLRNNSLIEPTELREQVRKINEQRDYILRSTEEHYARLMSVVKQSHREEEDSYNQAYTQALANRQLIGSNLSPADLSSATTSEAITRSPTVGETKNILERVKAPATAQESEPQSPGVSASPPAAPREPSQPALPEKGFSATVQREFAADGGQQYVLRYKTKNRKALQEALRSQVKRPAYNTKAGEPVTPTPTPAPTHLNTSKETRAARTITFHEIYKNGQAEHKDKIVEYPPDSGQWYILKCEKHQLHFKLKPLLGAAKHLSGRLHGYAGRTHALAIQFFGYRVIDCNQELAMQNNKVVYEAFANGYMPASVVIPEHERKSQPKQIYSPKPLVPDHLNKKTGNDQVPQGTRAPGSGQNPSKPPEVLTNPKPFHVYYCLWAQNKCYYPVMILGWDDQAEGGLETNLAGTGLLDKKQSTPPSCYIYKNVDSKTHGAIAGWSSGYEDGGRKVKQRKFPVKFFDRQSNVGWVSAKDLSKFPLYRTDDFAKREFDDAARRYIAKREGFSSWEEFETARKTNNQETKNVIVPTPIVSPLTDADEYSEDSETEDFTQSSTSHVTDNMLEDMRDIAGEIEGDEDYLGSDMDSTLDGESEWAQPEANGRPWAFYNFRKDEQTPKDTNAEPPGDTNLKTASTPETSSSVKAGSSLEPGFQKIYAKGVVEKDGIDDTLGSVTSTPSIDAVSTASRTASPPKEAAWPTRHTPTKHAKFVTESSLGPLVRSSSSYASGPARLVSPEAIENKERRKRARSEEAAEIDIGTPRQEDAKKARLETEPPEAEADSSEVLQLAPKPCAPAIAPFIACKTPGACQFELSFYCRGRITWKAANGLCLELWFQEDQKRVGTVDAVLSIVIDPTTLRGFMKEEIPESKGNSLLTLVPKDVNDEPVKVVFDRGQGSKKDIGKIQARRFIMWMRDVVPSLALLKSTGLK